MPPCEALRDDELMVGTEAENSKGWLHKAGRRTGVHALLATPAYLSWLAKRDGDGVVANCGVVGGPRARLLRALDEVGRHLLAALRGAAPANASGIDMAVWNLAPLWAGKIVPLYIDNRSFQLSAVKGWSKAARLYQQLKALFSIALKYECVYEFHWISTHENVLADAL